MRLNDIEAARRDSAVFGAVVPASVTPGQSTAMSNDKQAAGPARACGSPCEATGVGVQRMSSPPAC